MSHEDRELISQQVKTMQIIVAALAMGVVMFGAIVAVVIRPEQAQDLPIVSYIAVGFAVPSAVAGFVVPRLIADQQPASVATYQTKLIIGAALLEGAAFFNLIAYLIEGQLYSLAVAGILLFLILLHFPTANGVQDWLERRERQQRE